LERLVERILSAKQRDAGADVSALARRAEAVAQAEAELDELVYALYYGLTPAEIKIVESASARAAARHGEAGR
jgi:tRNA A37 threonylcarbamoyladenosine synthetase subunit TsaC/SUA5/YrdC